MPRLLTNPDLVRAYAAAFVLLLSFVAFYVALSQSRGEALAALGLNPLEVRAVALPGMLTALLAPKLMPRLGPVRSIASDRKERIRWSSRVVGAGSRAP